MPVSEKKHSFIYITLLSLILICALFFIHIRSTNSIRELQKGNELAGRTFQINKALQETINNINTVEIAFQNKARDTFVTGQTGIYAGIGAMKKNSDWLIQLTQHFPNKEIVPGFTKLIKKKAAFFDATNSLPGPASKKTELVFSAQSRVLNDSIYVSALAIQLEAENQLQNNISRNFSVSGQALSISKGFTVLAIGAILLLATIIIMHLVKNLQLIKALAQSKQQADNAADIKEQFLANMSHEIRTPVNSIIGFTRLLQKTPLLPEQGNFVNYIKSSGENLLYIVNDILDISKIEAGMLQIKKEPFQVSEFCEFVQMMFHNESKSKKIKFTCTIGKEVPEIIVGDEDRLKQVATNIIGNAFKFTSSGEIKVTLDAEKVSPELVNLIFKISDTGIGIPADKIATIFERFEQVDNKTTKSYGGTGLGLSIVKKLVNMQGGQITVSSTLNKGSVFTFTLPVQLPGEMVMSELKMVNSDGEQSTEKRFPAGYKILAAEDNKMNQLLLQHMFKQWNLKLTLANDGGAVMKCLEESTYDLVLMDIQMPDIDGYQATTWIRKTLKSDVPIIAMTAFVLQGEKEKCLSYGMNAYLPKPIDENDLKDLLLQYLPSKKKTERKNWINLPFLQQTFNNNEFVKNILSLFVVQYPKDLDRLKICVSKKDIQGVKSAAHHLKSTVLSVNNVFPELEALQTLEETGSENPDWTFINQLCNKVMASSSGATKEAGKLLKKL